MLKKNNWVPKEGAKENERFETKAMTIKEACKKWPDSKARAFKIKGKGTKTYFMLEEWPDFVKSATFRSAFTAVAFDESTHAYRTKLLIRNDWEIEALTFREYWQKVEDNIAWIEAENFKEEIREEILNSYKELLGYD